MPDMTVNVVLYMPPAEADAFARFLQRCTYMDCVVRSSHVRRYAGREETDVMWAALRMVQTQFAEVGFIGR